MTDKVSVLMSVYAKENAKYLTETFVSLTNQTYKADEVILVEDGPIPIKLVSIIKAFRNQLNIISIRLKENSGLAVALNEGLKHCSHTFIARMDTDDIALPERLLNQLNVFKTNPELDVVGTFALEIDEYGVVGNLRKMPITHDLIYDNLFTNPFIHPSVMFKKASLLSLGGYNEALVRRQDYDLWFRCAKAGMKFYNIPKPLLLYRFTEKTHSRQNMKLMLNQAMIGYRGAVSINQPYYKSLLCFVPLLRSMLPTKLQHIAYTWMKSFDPRQKGGES